MNGDRELALVYAINHTDRWWKYIAENLGFPRHLVVSDIRGAGDRDTVDDFNAEYRRQRRLSDIQTQEFEEHEVRDVISGSALAGPAEGALHGRGDGARVRPHAR
jgi:hypothetical protein